MSETIEPKNQPIPEHETLEQFIARIATEAPETFAQWRKRILGVD